MCTSKNKEILEKALANVMKTREWLHYVKSDICSGKAQTRTELFKQVMVSNNTNPYVNELVEEKKMTLVLIKCTGKSAT